MDKGFTEVKDTSATDKLLGIAKESPMLPLGMVALTAIVGHGLYNLKRRNMKLSLYLIHYRVVAQGTFLGCLTLGMAYTLFRDHVWKKIKG